MRNAFVAAITELAERDDRVWLLTGDLGFNVLEDFARRFPDRFVNTGIAEQNMVGLAAGLAANGAIPFVYSIANFPVMRCLEQVRNDVCYHDLPVRIVAVGGGFTYAAHGYTHLGIEDLAIMRALPGMAVIAPGDPLEAAAATHALIGHAGPAYLRLGRAGEEVVHASPPAFTIGRAIEARPGTDGTLVATGGVLTVAMEAARRLAEDGTQVQVLSMPSIEPFDATAILAAARNGPLVSIEEHGRGGLAAAISEVLATSDTACRFTPLYIQGAPPRQAGGQDYLRARFGLTAEAMVDAIRSG